MNEKMLSKYLRRTPSVKSCILFALTIPCLVLVSWLGIGECSGITPESPGGNFFEIAFWLTSIGSAFLSYVMLEVLFRSRETQILAPWPVKPESIFLYQMKRIFVGIFISTLPYAALWIPHLWNTPLIALYAILLWPVGLSICAAVSAAVILYTGDVGTAEKNKKASFGAMAFSMAPAVSLAVSLMSTLLLKLLAEALLKPGFENAALTAICITSIVFLASILYAAGLFKRRYYAILASFMDNDMLQINAGYEFIDGKCAAGIRKCSSHKALVAEAFLTMYRRRHPVAAVLVITFACIFTLVLCNSPEHLSSPFVSFIPLVPWVIFSKPWSAFLNKDIDTGLLDFQPMNKKDISRASIRASLKLMLIHGGILTISLFVPYLIHDGIISAAGHAVFFLFICILITIIFCAAWPALKKNISSDSGQ